MSRESVSLNNQEKSLFATEMLIPSQEKRNYRNWIVFIKKKQVIKLGILELSKKCRGKEWSQDALMHYLLLDVLGEL